MPTFHIGFNPITNTTSVYVYNLTHVQMSTLCLRVSQNFFNDPHTAKLAKNDINLTVYKGLSVDLICKCTFDKLSKGTKKPVKVDFYIAKEEGSVLLSWETIFQLQFSRCKISTWVPSPKGNSLIQCSGLS